MGGGRHSKIERNVLPEQSYSMSYFASSNRKRFKSVGKALNVTSSECHRARHVLTRITEAIVERVGSIYNATTSMGRIGKLGNLLTPMQPEKCMVHLYLPGVPGMRTILYIELIGDVQFNQFLHELFGVGVERLVLRCCTNKHL